MQLKTLDSVPKNRQIVAASINNKMSGSHAHVAEAVEIIRSGKAEKYNISVKFYTRLHMEWMAACDLGKHWEKLSKCPTYFGIDEDGNYCVVKDGVFKWLKELS